MEYYLLNITIFAIVWIYFKFNYSKEIQYNIFNSHQLLRFIYH